MRVNVYAEEMTDRIEIIAKEIEGQTFTGLRFYLELPTSLPKDVWLAGSTPAVNRAYAEVPTDEVRNVKGPFHHRPGDDDSAAVTFWGKRDLRRVLVLALDKLDAHYASRAPAADLADPTRARPDEPAAVTIARLAGMLERETMRANQAEAALQRWNRTALESLDPIVEVILRTLDAKDLANLLEPIPAELADVIRSRANEVRTAESKKTV